MIVVIVRVMVEIEASRNNGGGGLVMVELAGSSKTGGDAWCVGLDLFRLKASWRDAIMVIHSSDGCNCDRDV